MNFPNLADPAIAQAVLRESTQFGDTLFGQVAVAHFRQLREDLLAANSTPVTPDNIHERNHALGRVSMLNFLLEPGLGMADSLQSHAIAAHVESVAKKNLQDASAPAKPVPSGADKQGV